MNKQGKSGSIWPSFEVAFATTENGHLLSGPMKRLLGLLLQVLWSQQVNHFDFQFKILSFGLFA